MQQWCLHSVLNPDGFGLTLRVPLRGMLESRLYPLEEVDTEMEKVKSKKIYGVSYDKQ